MNLDVALTAEPVEDARLVDGWVVGKVGRLSMASLTDKDYMRLSAARGGWETDELANRLALGYVAPLPDDLALEFANLSRGDEKGALAFIGRYGVFERDYKDPGSQSGRPSTVPATPPPEIKKLLTAWERDGRKTFAVFLEDLWELQAHLRVLIRLAAAIRSVDYARIEAECRSIRFESALDVEHPTDWLEVGREILCADISAEINDPANHVSTVALNRQSAVFPVLSSATLRPLIFLSFLANVSRQEPLAECENPKCRRVFRRTRDTKRFCDQKCQALEKVNRFRRNGGEAKLKKGKGKKRSLNK